MVALSESEVMISITKIFCWFVYGSGFGSGGPKSGPDESSDFRFVKFFKYEYINNFFTFMNPIV